MAAAHQVLDDRRKQFLCQNAERRETQPIPPAIYLSTQEWWRIQESMGCAVAIGYGQTAARRPENYSTVSVK